MISNFVPQVDVS